MGNKIINKVSVNFNGNNISDEEVLTFINIAQAKHARKIVKADVTIDGDYVWFNYFF